MRNEIPKKFTILFSGPYNTSLKMDYTKLSNFYDDFRRNVYKILQAYNSPTQNYYIERFQNNKEDLHNWIDQNGTRRNQLLFNNPQGITHRDTALFCTEISQTILPNENLYSEVEAYLTEIPKIEKLTLKFQENGIGTFSSTIELNLKKSIFTKGNQYKNFMQKLRDAFVLSPELIRTLDLCDGQVFESAKTAFPKIISQKPIINSTELYPHEKDGFPLWGHALAFFTFDYDTDLPFGDDTKNMLIVSHPDGMIDMNPLSKDFIHIGWGLSLAVNVSPNRIRHLESSLTQLQFYWRAAQILNDIVMKYLEKYTLLKKFTLNDIKNSMNEMENLTVESELFFSYHMDYLKMLSPLAHYLYVETAKSWRINDMINYFNNKKEALASLHQQGETRLKENLENKRNKMSDRLNILLSILALLTLFSWAADSIGFLDATLNMLPRLKPFLIGGKFLVIVLTPLLLIGIFLFFIKVTHAMENLEE